MRTDSVKYSLNILYLHLDLNTESWDNLRFSGVKINTSRVISILWNLLCFQFIWNYAQLHKKTPSQNLWT